MCYICNALSTTESYEFEKYVHYDRRLKKKSYIFCRTFIRGH